MKIIINDVEPNKSIKVIEMAIVKANKGKKVLIVSNNVKRYKSILSALISNEVDIIITNINIKSSESVYMSREDIINIIKSTKNLDIDILIIDSNIDLKDVNNIEDMSNISRKAMNKGLEIVLTSSISLNAIQRSIVASIET